MIWTIVCFGLTLFVLKRYAFGPIQKTIDDRRERVRQTIEEADRAREEATGAARGAPRADRAGEERGRGDPHRGQAHLGLAARAGSRRDRGGSPAAPRGDEAPDRAGDRAGARPDPRRGRQAEPARRGEDHAHGADRRRPAAADRRGARRARLRRPREELVVALAHRMYARALFEAAQGRGSLDAVASRARRAAHCRRRGAGAAGSAHEPRGRLAGEERRPRRRSPRAPTSSS